MMRKHRNDVCTCLSDDFLWPVIGCQSLFWKKRRLQHFWHAQALCPMIRAGFHGMRRLSSFLPSLSINFLALDDVQIHLGNGPRATVIKGAAIPPGIVDQLGIAGT